MSDIINNAKCINLFFQKNKISILMYYWDKSSDLLKEKYIYIKIYRKIFIENNFFGKFVIKLLIASAINFYFDTMNSYYDS